MKGRDLRLKLEEAAICALADLLSRNNLTDNEKETIHELYEALTLAGHPRVKDYRPDVLERCKRVVR